MSHLQPERHPSRCEPERRRALSAAGRVDVLASRASRRCARHGGRGALQTLRAPARQISRPGGGRSHARRGSPPGHVPRRIPRSSPPERRAESRRMVRSASRGIERSGRSEAVAASRTLSGAWRSSPETTPMRTVSCFTRGTCSSVTSHPKTARCSCFGTCTASGPRSLPRWRAARRRRFGSGSPELEASSPTLPPGAWIHEPRRLTWTRAGKTTSSGRSSRLLHESRR